MADDVPGAWQRAQRYFRRRRMLFVGTALVFVAGLAAGAFAGFGSGAPPDHPVHSYIEGMWKAGRSALAGRPGESQPALSDVLRVGMAGAGGLLYVIGGCMFMALSIVGAPFALAVLFWRGFGLGYTALLLVHTYGWRGGFLAIAVLGPHNGLNVPGLLLAVATTMELSWRVLRMLFGFREGPMGGPMLRALIGWTVGGVLLMGGALTEAYVTPSVAGWIARGFFGE